MKHYLQEKNGCSKEVKEFIPDLKEYIAIRPYLLFIVIESKFHST